MLLMEIFIEPEDVSLKKKLVEKLISFKKIADNIEFLEKNLEIYFSGNLKQKIISFQQKMIDQSLPFEILYESYKKLPTKIKSADDQKIRFIEKMASVENYKGKLFV